MTPEQVARRKKDRHRGPRPDRHKGPRRPPRTEGLIIAIDGEGRPNGCDHTIERDELRGQDYFLMVASDAEQRYSSALSTPAGRLPTERIFTWLCNLPRDSLLIGYGLNYDSSMWLADLTTEECAELRDRNSRRYGIPAESRVGFRPYIWKAESGALWELDRYGSVFKVRPKGSQRWCSVWDVIKCYQRKFLTTLEAWFPDLSPIVHDLIEYEKGRRGGTDKEVDSQTEYSTAECWTLAEIHDRFRNVLREHGIEPRSWHGASIAKVMLKRYNVEAAYMERSRVVRRDGSSYWRYPGTPGGNHPIYGNLDRKSYVGGRFELSAHGPIPGPIYEPDLTSAYPYWETQLPNLAGATWEHSRSRSRALKHPGWFLSRVSWDMPAETIWGPFPRRTSAALQFARTGQAWVWSPEVRVVAKWHPEHFTVHESWLLHSPDDSHPFAYISETFDLRAELEREAKGKGDPLKIGMNSTYGALAEQTNETPHWQNFVWSGMIASGTRSQVLDATYTVGQENVLAIATDAIYCRTDPSAQLGVGPKVLGGWEVTTHNSGWFFARSGVLLPLEGGGKLKSRGLPARDLSEALPDFLDAWARDGTGASVEIPVQRFFGFNIGIIRPTYRNHWAVVPVKVNLSVEPKRRRPFVRDGIVRSLPVVSDNPSALEGWGQDEPENLTNLADILKGDQPDWLNA